jgi:hypothetical protein
VNSSAVLLALLSFQLWPFSVKEFLANYLGPLSPGDLNPRATANIGHNLISGHSQHNDLYARIVILRSTMAPGKIKPMCLGQN